MPVWKDHTGEKRIMHCGMEAEVIEYKKADDIVVQFSDGTIVSHRTYDNFLKGKIKNPNCCDSRLLQKAASKIGERRMMNCGVMAEIIEYKHTNDITVKFDDDTIVAHRAYSRFVTGGIANPNLPQVTTKVSRVGERRMMKCGMEAEIIEYKGARDITVKFADGAIARHKVYAAFKNGQMQNPNFTDYQKRVGERRMMNCGLVAEIIEYKNSEDITVKFDDGTIVAHKAYHEFYRGGIGHPAQNTRMLALAKIRVGERRMMNCGMEAEIIDYKNTCDITVKFDDGAIVPYKTYQCFKRGDIASPNCKMSATSVGETALLYYLAPYGYKKALCGSLKEYGLKRYEIDAFNQNEGIGIEYDGPWHQDNIERDAQKNDLFFKAFKKLIRIRDFCLPCNDKRVEYYQVDTGKGLSKEYETMLKNVFRSLGLSIDVNLTRDKDKIYDLYYKNSPRNRLGEKRRMSNGFIAEIVQYRSAKDIDVQFEDGAIKNTNYSQFVCGIVAHPKYPIHHSQERLGMRRLMACGMEAEIIQYNKSHDITVRFDDGTIVAHKQYDDFLRGVIGHPDFLTMGKYRIGEHKAMNCGMKAEIIEYQNYHDITVRFDDGTIVSHCTYDCFVKGHIYNPNILCSKKIGEKRLMHCGMNAKIIEYRNANDMTIQFEDGVIVANRSYRDFLKGGIRHPNKKCHYKTRNVEHQTATA